MNIKVNWSPDASELRKFGIALIIGLGIIGSVFYWVFGQAIIAKALWCFGLAGGLAGLTGTVIAMPFYYVWMGFATVMSTIIGTAIYMGVYYLVITPIAILAKIIGRDRLGLKKKEDTYWVDIPKSDNSSESYQKQF